MTQIIAAGSRSMSSWSYYGAAVIGFIGSEIPLGQIEMAVGKYLWQGTPTEDFKYNILWIYEDRAEFNSPKILWLKGHLYDLTHKVLATAFFYLVLPKKAYLPLTNLLSKYHLSFLIWTPVILKCFQFALDGVTAPADSIYLKQKVEQIQNGLMTLYCSPLLMGADLCLMMIRGFDDTLFIETFAISIYFFARFMGFMMYSAQAKKIASLVSSLPARLSEIVIDSLPDSNQKSDIDQINETFSKSTIALKDLTAAKLINPQHLSGILHKMSYRLTLFLQKHLYPKLDVGDFSMLENYEADLRSIFDLLNPFEPNDPDTHLSHTYLYERFRFTTMLLYTNLRRLKAVQNELTESQFKYVQYGLREQALDTINGRTWLKTALPGNQQNKAGFIQPFLTARDKVIACAFLPKQMDLELTVLLNTLSTRFKEGETKISILKADVSKLDAKKSKKTKDQEAADRAQFIHRLYQQKKPLTFDLILQIAREI